MNKTENTEKKIERPEVERENERKNPKSKPHHKGYWDKVKPINVPNKDHVID